jgi:peptidoglycan-associated lipoprotein
MTWSRAVLRASLPVLVLLAACSKTPPPPPPAPVAAVDSAAQRARADSAAAAAARRDSVARAARADSLARLRADSVSRAVARSRADSVRAQVLRDSAEGSAATPSGLDSATSAAFAATIYFETDRSDFSSAAALALDRKAAILRTHPRLEVQVEGHCDERGPDEYNLALGNRRAAAVKQYLVEHGIAEARITIVSYGEERPVVRGSTEEAWAKNRRAEFTVTRSAR